MPVDAKVYAWPAGRRKPWSRRLWSAGAPQTLARLGFMETLYDPAMVGVDPEVIHEDTEGVKDFARGCMCTYLILKEKAKRFSVDAEIQGLLAQVRADDGLMDAFRGKYTPQKAAALKACAFDRVTLGQRGMKYERLVRLVNERPLGVR